jgi:hypothetical protein
MYIFRHLSHLSVHFSNSAEFLHGLFCSNLNPTLWQLITTLMN